MEWLVTEYNYVMRATIPNIGPLFKPREDAICLKFIPLLTIASQFCSTSKHKLLSLTCHLILGGLGIVDPTIVADSQYDIFTSTSITKPLKNLVIQQFMTAQLPDVMVPLNTEFIWIEVWLIKNKLMPLFIFTFHHPFNGPRFEQ